MPLDAIDNARFYFPKTGNDSKIIFLRTKNVYYTFEYVRDRFYLLKLLAIGISLFLGAYIFVIIIQTVIKYRIKQQQKIKQQISELEFQNIRAQMSPHFILNTLNFISTAVLKNQKEDTYDVISGFSNIIRSSLMDSYKVLRPLMN